MSSRDLKDKEKKDFEAHGINPVKIPVALDAIIPVVSPKNAVASLTMEQLRDLFAGKIKNWKELGGADAPVVVVGRDSSSGTFESWQELVMGKTRVSQRALLQSSSGGVVQAVAGNPNAIGYIGVGYLDSQIKGLVVNGVQPGAKTAQDGTWPISRELYLFTSGQPQGDAKKLVDYTLSAVYDGMKVSADEETASAVIDFTYGADVTNIRYVLVENELTEAETATLVAAIADGSAENINE